MVEEPDKTPEWERKHPNPSGLPLDPDDKPLPLEPEHHEEGHEDPPK